MTKRSSQLAIVFVMVAANAVAQGKYSVPAGTGSGVSAVWLFANLSYTGMRAQASHNSFWRIVTFIFGFPGTLLTLFVVREGSERAYGVDMPRRR